MKYYTGEQLKKEFEGIKIDTYKPIEDNAIYTPVQYNYHSNEIECKKVYLYTGDELLNDAALDRTKYNIEVQPQKLYKINKIESAGYTKEYYPLYYIELETIKI